ncbi:ATP-dependent helicase/deoxyribonuclease subunit B [Stieleria maiorica]|uniref:ATP-dependent helicase/deoxyribonuclease subunit B n=1 Tax=Stieleria maiorica TaxID=2795974 RepID=A0A5B9MC38_9BACT|nr:PD-(D/E)XK nuclease family protein [Stieleria maiorica]QEF97590.1 ATP-dependent helicase/deoxyribonuclease subunit B [Stieleria maiorica]
MSDDLFPTRGCRREFVGWDRPLLPQVAGTLIDSAAENATSDFSGWICVLPTAQSSLRFGQLLRSAAESQGLDYTAPRILTAGDLAEALYEPEKPIAIEFEQTLAWARVLRQWDARSLRPLLPVLPETDAIGPWLELAGTLRRLTADLAAHDVSFTDVVVASDRDDEKQRWKLLQELYGIYLSELATAGISDPHQQRRRAIERKTIRSDRRIALIGTSDLNPSVANVINAVDGDLVAYIAAPSDKASWFDDLGCLRTDAFAKLQLPLADQHLVPAGDIADQATAVSEAVTEFAASHPIGQIAVGVTDESHVEATEMQLDGCGFPSYRHVGWTVASTAVGRLVSMTATLVARPTWRSLAALVRHGDVHRVLTSRLAASQGTKSDGKSARQDYLIPLDQMLANHLPVNLADPLPTAAMKNYPVADQLRTIVLEWLSALIPSQTSAVSTRTRPIADWCLCLLEWLDSIYAGFSTDDAIAHDRRLTAEAVSKARELLTRFTKLSGHLDVPVTAASALEMIAARLADLRVGQVRGQDDIQIHGWLDLALDDSPAMVVVGFNHPYVPAAVTSDPFLPGSLRSRLGIADNERRYARDVYATQLLLSTRKDVRLIVGKRSADGSPTPPSRLLAASPTEDVARRIRTLLGGTRHKVNVSHRWDNDRDTTELPIPKIQTTECPVKTMSVTAFKAYLECPYRFYLRHVLQLKPVDDSARELAANQFGDLVHGAVEHFGESAEKDEADEKRIFDSLRHHLHDYAANHYGDHAESAVRLQVRQAEQRLRFVAAEQAKRIDQGWRIHATEASVEESKGAGITVDGKKMGLRGRFDRIDRHVQTGQWAILDYKTHGHKPEKKHLRKNRDTGEFEWIDLQLPLYRMMVPFLGIDAPPQEVQLGYFNVSDKAEETKINLAEFGEPLMQQAIELIHQCVRRIFACDFSPNEQGVMYDDYEMILQTGVASRMLAGASVGEGDNDQ